jgi:hypothetical protein
MEKNKLSVSFDVYTNQDITVDDFTKALLDAEMLLNEKTKLRWHLDQAVLQKINFLDTNVVINNTEEKSNVFIGTPRLFIEAFINQTFSRYHDISEEYFQQIYKEYKEVIDTMWKRFLEGRKIVVTNPNDERYRTSYKSWISVLHLADND